MTILAYHMVDRRFDASITHVLPRQFARQMECALNLGFHFFTLHELLQAPDDAKNLALTFDDGFRSVYENAWPILKALGIPATVFMLPAFAGQYDSWDVNFFGIRFRHLDWRQLEALKASGWEIGSHGMSHRDLTRLCQADLAHELTAAKTLLNARLDAQIRYFSYPFGNVDARVASACLQAGYEGAVIMARKPAGIPALFALPRLGIYLFEPLSVFRQKILRRHAGFYAGWQYFVDCCSDGTVLVKQGFLPKNKNCA
jgi:peptidoglycan/xylan/chitin deacetylase (PgdA/CDA1 family)